MKLKIKNDTKYRIAASLIILVLTAVCAAITTVVPIETTSVKIIGSFAAVAVISIVTWKFPLYFYVSALIFDVFAAVLGSVINLYKSIGFYDRFVHYLSGILLGQAGLLIIEYLTKRCRGEKNQRLSMIFAFFFSSACAGFWEIYEFTADALLGINMQGGNSNTMGDIVSGVLGAFTYFVIGYVFWKNKKEKNKNK